MSSSETKNDGSKSTPSHPFWRRYLVPIIIVVLVGGFEIVNWTTNFTSEKLVPQFATSAQTVFGRLAFILGLGLLLGWMLITRQVRRAVKLKVFGAVALVVVGLAACIREVENTGNNNYVIHWRWEKTQDQRLAEYQESTSKPESTSFVLDADSPKFTDFLGVNRDGIVDGPALQTDLVAHPPKEIWRRPVGGGYAGCVLSGGLAIAIEQREENEVVVAMDLKTGKDVWTRAYPGHFKEDLGGNGPRATPTIAGNEVFALGASGLLVCLDLASGQEKWQTNILTDADAKNIQWGMSGAPLVVENRVIVNPGGEKLNCGLVAYDRTTGKKLWCGGKSPAGYSSPALTSLADTKQALIFDAWGLAGHDLDSGEELWRFEFKTFNGINVGQPITLPNNQVLVSAGYDAGAVLLNIKRDGGTWTAEQVWKSKTMKCKMGSCIYYEGHIYGLDDGILCCIDATNGKRKWKSGRYGHGQFVLRKNVLVIQAESGDLALVAADPEKFRELSKVPVLGGGKTWNAPALAGNLLLLKNHFEAVLLELPTE